jgi:hypothetical protein
MSIIWTIAIAVIAFCAGAFAMAVFAAARISEQRPPTSRSVTRAGGL